MITGAPGRGVGAYLAVLAALVGGSVGCAARVSPGASGTGAADGGRFDAAVGTGGAGGPGCTVTVTPLSPTSFTGLAVGTALRVRAQTAGAVGANARWIWSATFADGSTIPVAMPMSSDPAVAEIVIARAGSHTVAASFDGAGSTCGGAAHFIVDQPGARSAFFALRLTPPPLTLPAQQLQPRQILGGTPTGDNVLLLDAGTQVNVSPRRTDDGAAVAAYVKAIETTTGLFQEGHTTAAGGNVVLALPAGRYDLLIAPEGGDLPPLLIRDQRPIDLATMTFALDGGVSVDGQLTDAAGAPLAGAKVSLRAGALPSTVGTSSATGTFTLRVRPGTYGATIVPGAALPDAELSIAAAPGVTVAAPGGGAPATLSLRLATLPTTRIGLTVTGAGANAKALIEGLAPVAGAAMVEIAAGGTTTMRAATMRVRAELAIGANGVVQTGALPRGHYRATVFAAGAGPQSATVTTLADIDATAGDVTGAMTMAQPVDVSGSLDGGGSTLFARVVAIDVEGPLALAPEAVAPFRTDVAGTGSFLLRVNPSRLYRLIVEPTPGSAFARTVLPSVSVAAAAVVIPRETLPAALFYGGRVLGPHLEPMPGTLVSAFCATTSPGCVDPTRPIAEAVTTSDGAFRLVLPDPGFAQ